MSNLGFELTKCETRRLERIKRRWSDKTREDRLCFRALCFTQCFEMPDMKLRVGWESLGNGKFKKRKNGNC